MRKFIIAGNWKLNKTGSEAVELATALKAGMDKISKVDAVICPTFTALVPAAAAIAGSTIGLGAQNMYWEESGAYTGEISTAMLLDAGCQYVIIGHSERRQYFGETNETVNKKVKKALEAGLTPIMCIGETLEEREGNITEKVIKTQVEGGLTGISADDLKKMVIAYEPIWAIGTGKTASPQQAQDVHAFIRGLLVSLYSQGAADAVRIQYGGSMKPSNADELLQQPDIDGGLIGGAALKADMFLALLEIGEKLS